LNGTLTEKNGCLVVGSTEGITLIYFPKNEVGTISDRGIWLFGKEHHLGDQVTYGGGYYAPSSPSIPEACEQIRADSNEFTVAQRD